MSGIVLNNYADLNATLSSGDIDNNVLAFTGQNSTATFNGAGVDLTTYNLANISMRNNTNKLTIKDSTVTFKSEDITFNTGVYNFENVTMKLQDDDSKMNTYTFNYLTVGGVNNTLDLTVDMDLTANTIDNLVIKATDYTKTQTIRLSDINVMNIPTGTLIDPARLTLLTVYKRGIADITNKVKLTISDDITDRTTTGGVSA